MVFFFFFVMAAVAVVVGGSCSDFSGSLLHIGCGCSKGQEKVPFSKRFLFDEARGGAVRRSLSQARQTKAT